MLIICERAVSKRVKRGSWSRRSASRQCNLCYVIKHQDIGVCFDLWHTLITDGSGRWISPQRANLRAELARRVLNAAGVEVGFEAVADEFQQTTEQIFAEQANGKDLLFAKRVKTMALRLGAPAERANAIARELGRAIDVAFEEHSPRLIDGALELLRSLSSKGVKIALISNTGVNSPQVYFRWFEKLGIADCFAFVFLSNAYELAKPAQAVFEMALAQLKTAPQRTIHVGDNLDSDIAGARNSGIASVWVSADNGAAPPGIKPDFKIASIADFDSVFNQWVAQI